MDPIAQVGALGAAIGTMAGFIVWMFIRYARNEITERGFAWLTQTTRTYSA